MIQDIREINIPQYAALTKATVTLPDMGEKSISADVKIDVDVVPDFTRDWEVEFRGEKYIMPLRVLQGMKDNESLLTGFSLTFQHWATYQLKRWYFFSVVNLEAGTTLPDKYIYPVSLNLEDFCTLFGKVLAYYYGDSITIDLNPGWDYKPEPVTVEISHSYIWDVLIKFHDLFGVRWQIEPNGDIDHYVIKVGYGAGDISHIFKHGFEGGLLKIEQQVQDENIRNMIIGRGGEKNLPYRYFKDTDPDNPSFIADPDWIPELKDIYFSELHGATFRSYIQGWNHRHYKRSSVTSADKAYAPWAWMRGYTDEKFNPVEFVADEFTTESNGYAVKSGSSIDRYGELMGSVENNDEIYPTIQGVLSGSHLNFFGQDFGRVDQTVWVEQMTSDQPREEAANDAEIKNIAGTQNLSSAVNISANGRQEITITPGYGFYIPSGKTGNLIVEGLEITASDGATVVCESESVVIKGNGKELSASGIPSGTWQFEIRLTLHNTSDKATFATATYPVIKLETATPSENLDTFDILIKNIWGTTKLSSETEGQYAERVWLPILGDKESNEAKVVFSSGWLSTSEDYEFTIIGTPKHEETPCNVNGVSYTSHWRLTLARSTADYDTIGKLVPGKTTNGHAGDYFFFTGIELPCAYWIWAEEDLDDYKKDVLAEKSDIKPTFVVTPDKVRLNNLQKNERELLIDQLQPGRSVTIYDSQFIPGSHEENLYLQSVTLTYNEPTEKEANLLPDVEIILSNDYTTSANPVEMLSGEVSELRKQIGSLNNVSQAVKATGDKRYVRKDRSDSTPYSLNAKQGFTAGDFIAGASGAAVDGRGNAEVESIVVRSFMKVFELVYNRLNALEGNTSFADSGTIESITDNGDSTYTAVMRKRWEGDFTSFQVGDVVYGYVNDLRKEAPEGYVYSEDTENTGNTESPKEGGYVYYKAWAYVSEVDRASNTLTLVRYADTDTPANKNFPMRADMLISRWGNNVTPCEEAASDENHKSFIVNRNGKWINTRQQSFYISCDDGNIVELMGVHKPILDASNYGTVLGQLPGGLADKLGISDYINHGQPYLYARGIIVQDLIRISYQGTKLLAPYFRGEWQQATAESETDYYRQTDDSEDWVTHKGALYHYISDERTTLSPEEDNGVHWGKITGTLKPVWQIVPSVDKINIRDNGWSDKTIEVVVRATEITGVTDITTPEALDAYGKELVFSLDGVTYSEFWVRQGEQIDGTGLDRSGNNIPWMEVTDRILLTLRNKETHDEAMTVSVPVIKDGAKGENGESIKGADGTSVEMRYRIFTGFPDPSDVADLLDKGQRRPDGWKTTHALAKAGESLWCITATIDGDNSLVGEWNDPTLMTGKEGGEGKNGKAGPMAYPAGAYKTEVEYEGRYGTLPVVLDGEVYYILKEGKTWCGADKPATRNYPHLDYNMNDTETCWQMFDMFNTIFAKILMADHALLGDAVFWGQYMFSQWGKDASGNDTDRYSSFDGLATDTFTPNLLIDFLTGMLRCNNVELTGTINANGGRIGNLQIRGNSLVGLDENDDEVVRLGVGEVDLRETNATIGVRMGIKAMDAHPGITCGNTTDYACWAQTEAYCTPTSGNKMDLHATLTFTLGEDVETLKIERMGGSHTTGGGTYFGQPAISAILYRVQSGSRTATGATWDATDTKTFSGLAAGSYEVDVTVSFPALPSGQSWWGTIRLDTGIITATTARELGNLMEMARDGFLCRQGANKYLQFSKSEGFEVRFGSFGLKIDSDGIKGIKDNEWRKINIQYS